MMIVTLIMSIVDENDVEIVKCDRCLNLTYETIDELSRIFNDAGMDLIGAELTDVLEGATQ